jgi:hypothetical protein
MRDLKPAQPGMLIKGGDGSNASLRPTPKSADTGAEPSAAEEALYAIRNQLSYAKLSLIHNGRWTNEAGYITDAALWIERALSAAHEAIADVPGFALGPTDTLRSGVSDKGPGMPSDNPLTPSTRDIEVQVKGLGEKGEG